MSSTLPLPGDGLVNATTVDVSFATFSRAVDAVQQPAAAAALAPPPAVLGSSQRSAWRLVPRPAPKLHSGNRQV
eukprot:3471885-Lingulodinium_polyedra.AAC.1